MITMLEMREPTSEDYKKFASALVFAEQHENARDGYYMIVSIDGIEKLLQVIGHRCFLFTVRFGNEVSSIEFLLDDEYNLEYSAISKDYVVAIDRVDEDRSNDEYSYINNNNGNAEEFDFKGRDEDDPDGYNGYAIYVQYNNQTDTRLMMIYQHMFHPNKRVFKYHLNNPSFIIVDKNIVSDVKHKKERFVRKDFKYAKDPIAYNIATMKEHGVFKTLMNGAININCGADFSRYYHIFRETANEIRITFPFGSQYSLEELNKYIRELGFNTSVPDEIVDFYNGDNRDFKEIYMVADYLRKLYEYTSSMMKQLKMEKSDQDGNS